MTFIDQWRQHLPEALAACVQLATEVEDIDFTYGILAAGLLWPIRTSVREYDGDAADAMRELVGAQAGRVLKLINTWPDDLASSARSLAAQAHENPDLRVALTDLIDYFGAAQRFAEQLAHRLDPESVDTINITEEIRAALVNIGGITNIDTLVVHLSHPIVAPSPPLISKRARYLAGVLGTVIGISALLSIASFTRAAFTPPPPTVAPELPKMEGNFKIAVADFSTLDTLGHTVELTRAQDLAVTAFKTFQKNIAADTNISLWSPSDTRKVGAIRGATVEERAAAAEQLAKQINADVIVYGVIVSDTKTTRFTPEFYLVSGHLQDAEELVGPYEFGSRIEVSGDIYNTSVVSDLSDRLVLRIRVLAAFINGLSYYGREGQLAKAKGIFEGIAQTPEWNEREGKDVVYLFLGKAATGQEDFVSAHRYYSQSLLLNPDYARARFGIADMNFQLSKGTCTLTTTNSVGLREALAGYQHAYDAPFQPPQAEIKTKATLGIGNVYMCMRFAQLTDRSEEGRKAYQKVIDAFEGKDGQPGNVRVKQLAAQAHFGLGMLCLPDEEQRGAAAEAKLRCAVEHYQKAIDLSDVKKLKGVYWFWMADAYKKLKAYDQSDNAYVNAIQLDPANQMLYEQERQKMRQERLTPTEAST